ncbi:hypothetical protein ACUNI6_11380 [Serratia sp. IR-2025]
MRVRGEQPHHRHRVDASASGACRADGKQLRLLFMSSLERDLKSPTMHKLTELCEVMDVHPLTLLTLAYAGDSTRKADQLLAQVRQELEAVLKERDTP